MTRNLKWPEQPLSPGTRTGAARRPPGLRSVRHLSNWTLAALVVGVGATTAVLARSAAPTTAPAGSVTSGTVTQAPATPAPGGTAAQGTSPTVQAPVTVTTPSGVVIQRPSTGGSSAGGATTRARSPTTRSGRPADGRDT